MKVLFLALCAVLIAGAVFVSAADTIKTSDSDLVITPVFHGSLMLEYKGLVIHVDPWGRGDYSQLPPADLILITHTHRDHWDAELVTKLKKDDGGIIGPKALVSDEHKITVMNNGDTRTGHGIRIEAVPAYNIVRTRSNGEPFHPKGWGNGYVLTFADKRVYIAGDTENIPEMAELKDIDIAFLPCNLPYTMTTDGLFQAAKAISPDILYAYHLGETDVDVIKGQISKLEGMELRICK